MFFGFSLKKWITFFIEPMGLIILFNIAGLYFLFRNKLIKAKLLFGFAFLLLLVFSNPFIANYLTLQLVNQYSAYNDNTAIRYIHVLGNEHYKRPVIPNSIELSDTGTKRMLEAVMIYQRMDKKPTIIFTGYVGLRKSIANAKVVAEFANEFGVKPEDMIINSKPKDTIEEAIFSKTIVKNQPFLLVSSATHLPRAMRLFQQVGINPIAAPTDFKGRHSNWLSRPSIPDLQKSKNAIHEFLGIAWHYLVSI